MMEKRWGFRNAYHRISTRITARRIVSLLLAPLTLVAACIAKPLVTESDPSLIADVPPFSLSDAAVGKMSLRDYITEDAPQEAFPPPDMRDLVRTALTQLGVKYRYGGKTPRVGFDCSGLVVYAAEQSLGLKLPHHAATLAKLGTSVKRTELQEGDLVFFNTRGKRFSHMGIYLGENRFLHAPRTGAVVRIERMTAYWQKRYNGARRLDVETRIALATG